MNKLCDDYQLCPYGNCAWKCGLYHEDGWYICPNCGRCFWAELSDGDHEDYHCFYSGDGFEHSPPKKPSGIPVAGNCGRSWGTPEDNPAHVSNEEIGKGLTRINFPNEAYILDVG